MTLLNMVSGQKMDHRIIIADVFKLQACKYNVNLLNKSYFPQNRLLSPGSDLLCSRSGSKGGC